MARNEKRRNSKKYTSTKASSLVHEPEAAYNSPALLPISGGKETGYLRRSLALMGLDGVAPFNAVENVADFIPCIRQGVPKKALDRLIEITGMSAPEIATILRTSDRTLRRYSPRQKLNPEQSERVIELAKIYSRGEEVFGSLDSFKEWMNSSVMALGNQRPKVFLDTSLGIEMLMDELGRIEHGIFA